MYFVSARKGNSSNVLFTEPAEACNARVDTLQS